MKAGWEVKTLGDVAKVGAGNSAPQDDAAFKGGSYPFFRTSDVGRIKFGDINQSADYLNEQGIKGLRYFIAGTILLPKSGASTFLNHRVMLAVNGYVSSHLATIEPNKALVHERFLLYFLSTISAQDLIQDHSYPSLNLPIVSSIKIPLPVIAEQQRIVAILDKAFEQIAIARANTEKNLQNARALFESHLQNVFTQRGDGWVESSLDKVCDLITCGVAATPKYVDESEGVPFLSAQNVRDGEVVLDKFRHISKEFHRELTKKNKPAKGDILYSRVGSKFGEAGVVEHDFEFSVYVSLTLIKPKSEILNSYFLKHYLNSAYVKSIAINSISSSGVPNLNVKDVRQFPIKLPPISHQLKLVEEINELRVETQLLEDLYQRKLNALDALKKSLLHQAFAGEL